MTCRDDHTPRAKLPPLSIAWHLSPFPSNTPTLRSHLSLIRIRNASQYHFLVHPIPSLHKTLWHKAQSSSSSSFLLGLVLCLSHIYLRLSHVAPLLLHTCQPRSRVFCSFNKPNALVTTFLTWYSFFLELDFVSCKLGSLFKLFLAGKLSRLIFFELLSPAFVQYFLFSFSVTHLITPFQVHT